MRNGFLHRRRRRLPVYHQERRSDCGLTCLAMVAASYDPAAGVHAFDRGGMRGNRLAELVRLADRAGFASRAVRLEVSELGRLRLPAILHWGVDHFVVLARMRGTAAVIHDPAAGRRRVAASELDRQFSGVALELSPAPDYGQCAQSRAGRPRYRVREFAMGFRYLGRYLSWTLLLLIAVQMLSLVPAIATQLLIDNLVLARDRGWALRLLAGMGTIALLVVLLDAVRQRAVLGSGLALGLDSGAAVVRHLFRLPAAYFHERRPGDLLARLASLAPLKTAITEHAVDAIVQVVVIATTLGVMLFYSVRLTLTSVAGLLLSLICISIVLPARRRLAAEGLAHVAREQSSLLESIRAFDALRLLGLAPQRIADWQRHRAAAANAAARQGELAIRASAASGAIGAVEQLVFLGIGVNGVLEQRLTLGVLFAFMGLRGRLAAAAAQLAVLLQQLYMTGAHMDRLATILTAEPDSRLARDGHRASARGELSICGLTFAHGDGPPLFADFDLHAAAGDHVALLGPSGCGKSTLLGLMCGMHEPQAGAVRLDGLELSLWDPRSISANLSVVLQDDVLIDGTIGDNICCFESSPDAARMRCAAVRADIWDDVQALPMRQHTPVEGAGLSGGQRQRLLLARAFYRQPRILLLDEATAHLDAATEARVLDGIAALGITVVHATHRPAAAARAGRVVEIGRAA